MKEKILELNSRLEGFYRQLQASRDAYFSRFKVKPQNENRIYRSFMVQFLLERLPDDSTVVDLCSGDCATFLALDYLHKNHGYPRKVAKAYALDDNSVNENTDFDIHEMTRQHHGLQQAGFELVQVSGLEEAMVGAGERPLKERFPDAAAITLMCSLDALFIPGVIHKEDPYRGIEKEMELLFNELKGLPIYVCQHRRQPRYLADKDIVTVFPAKAAAHADILDSSELDFSRDCYIAGWHMNPKD